MLLEHREIHIWSVKLSDRGNLVRALYASCSEDERKRADAFCTSELRRLFTIGRGLLRSILALYQGQRPEQLRFRYGVYGKPVLQLAHPSPLAFNVAHSEDVIIYALTIGKKVGVDIESVRTLQDAECIAEKFFSPEEYADLISLHPHQRMEGFFNCWTRKEAYLKALGCGLMAPLDGFSVSLKPGEAATFLKFKGTDSSTNRWSLHHLTPADGFIGAVAIPTRNCRLVQRHFSSALELIRYMSSGSSFKGLLSQCRSNGREGFRDHVGAIDVGAQPV